MLFYFNAIPPYPLGRAAQNELTLPYGEEFMNVFLWNLCSSSSYAIPIQTSWYRELPTYCQRSYYSRSCAYEQLYLQNIYRIRGMQKTGGNGGAEQTHYPIISAVEKQVLNNKEEFIDIWNNHLDMDVKYHLT